MLTRKPKTGEITIKYILFYLILFFVIIIIIIVVILFFFPLAKFNF